MTTIRTFAIFALDAVYIVQRKDTVNGEILFAVFIITDFAMASEVAHYIFFKFTLFIFININTIRYISLIK